MTNFTNAWPHSSIQEIFPNIFFVMGTNITQHDGKTLQHSRNMIIVRHDNKLSLINTVRLNDEGLAALDALGKVENIIRIGAFHGRDDAFYLDHYKNSKLWAIKGMQHSNGITTDVELVANGKMPFPNCSFFLFETSKFPEGILYIANEGGILITCDSIKNWESADKFFSEATAKLYEQHGSFGKASISSVWKHATEVKLSDFEKLKLFSFQHLISAHGVPLLNHANEELTKSITKTFSE